MAKDQKWPFPKTFDTLKDNDVVSYSVSWDNGYQSHFTLSDASIIEESSPEWFTQPVIATNFSHSMAKQALLIHQQGKTTYPEWMREMAEAGITDYVVLMDSRSVIYYNTDKSQSITELVPQS